MTSPICIKAGPIALSEIRDGGLRPERIRAVFGAAGGPKWLIMAHMDRALFGRWLAGRKAPLFLAGSSSGAWRFACASQADPEAAIHRFAEAYIEQYYHHKPTPAEVTAEGWRIQNAILSETGDREILAHPFLRLHVLAVRCRFGPAALEPMPAQVAGLAAAGLCNLVSRRSMRYFFERALFADPRDRLPLGPDGFRLLRIPLTPDNIRPALMASGSIPLVMRGIRNIPGAPRGIYRDGGVIDYQMDLPAAFDDGIILFPHYMDRVVPGWLDKRITWRRPLHMDRVAMVAPSPEFLASLPSGKIPDRNDFWTFEGRDTERVACWREAMARGREMADAFMEAVESGRIRDRVVPL